MSGQVFSIMAFWNRNKILSDKELAEGIVRGDEVCYERFFERYYVVVRKFLMSFIGDRAAAEDLAQELFIRLWNRRLSIDPQKPLKNWLIVSARNAALNWLKAKRPRSRLLILWTTVRSRLNRFVYVSWR